MSHFQSWPAPCPLIESTKSGLRVIRQTALRLSDIRAPVVVIAIAGTYRTGKSYLMNRLAGQTTGFPLGSTIKAETKGIWVWCLNHPEDEKKALVLLDTEGLSDATKGDPQHDMMILTLAVLLSSTFVFNATGCIGQEMIDKLHFVTELTEKICIKTRSKNDDEFGDENRFEDFTEYFPHFVLAVRDFILDLKLDGKEVSPREYFERTLKYRHGNRPTVVNYNLPREAIRQAFKSYDCFVFVRPVQDDALFEHLDQIREDELCPKFIKQSKEFYDHVLLRSQPKKLKEYQALTGQTFVALAEQYVEAISSGVVPCIESTVFLVADNANRRLEKECLEKYLDLLGRLVYPMSEKDLHMLHKQTYTQAMDNFRQQVVFDKEGIFFKNMKDKITQAFNDLVEKNVTESRRKSTNVIEKLYSNTVKEKIKKQEYTTVGGYKVYDNDMKHIVDTYKATPDLGPKMEEVLSEFLAQRETERNTIMGADSQMTQKEKEIEAQKKAREAAEMQKEATEKDLEAQEERIKTLQEEHERQSKKIKEDFQKQAECHKKELEELLAKRVKDQENLIVEGHKQKAKEMEEEISNLRAHANIQTGIETFCHVMDRVVAMANVLGPMIERQMERNAKNSENLSTTAASHQETGNSAPEPLKSTSTPENTSSPVSSGTSKSTPENTSSVGSSGAPSSVPNTSNIPLTNTKQEPSNQAQSTSSQGKSTTNQANPKVATPSGDSSKASAVGSSVSK